MFRVLLAPLVVVLLLMRERSASNAAAAVFILGAATDGLDGYLARRYATATRIGQWLDPLADKILVAAPLLALAALGRFPLWAAVVIVFREAFVALLRMSLSRRGQAMPATPAAKAKTWAQMLAVGLYMVPLTGWAERARSPAVLVAVALTVWTGWAYWARARRANGGKPALRMSPE